MSRIHALKERIANEFLNPDYIKKFIRYLIVGVSTFTVEYILFLVFRKLLPLPDVVTNIFVYAFIFWFNFLLNKFLRLNPIKISKNSFCLMGFCFYSTWWLGIYFCSWP